MKNTNNHNGFYYLGTMTQQQQSQWKSEMNRHFHYKGYSQEESDKLIDAYLSNKYGSMRRFIYQGFLFESSTHGVRYWDNIANS